MTVFLPDFVKKVLDTLHKNGYDAYLVGGCVRDLLMGKVPHDYDITTAALPETVQALFPHTVATGLQHGTVTVLQDRQPVEVTTFRTEAGYADHRRPDAVTFVSTLKEDLSRRDFTVNAMAYCEDTDLVDLFGGKDDLEHKILRAVGDPTRRFEEDALRILRLFRFACVLHFEGDPATVRAALTRATGLEKISRERIREELQKAVTGDVCRLKPLLQSGALRFIGIADGDFTVFHNLPENENLRLFVFLSECCDDLLSTADALKFSNKQKEYCRKMQELCKLNIQYTPFEIKKLLRYYDGVIMDYVDYLNARSRNGQILKNLVDEIQKNHEPYRPDDLAISGNDLKALGYHGTEIGKMLEQLLTVVLEKPEANTPERLLRIAKKE